MENRTNSQRNPIRILGCGNLLMGDDGVGIRVIEALENTHLGSMDGVELIDAGVGGLDILNLLDGAGRVIIVDAMVSGNKVGSVCRFDGSELKGKLRQDMFSIHDLGIYDVLNIAKHVQDVPEVVIFGIEVGQISGISLELSSGMDDAVADAVCCIMDEVGMMMVPE